MDITLDDLRLLEPRLRRVDTSRGDARPPDPDRLVEVTWAVSARTTAPHLPLLRGGELLFVPPRVMAILATARTALVEEAKARGVSAIVLEASAAADTTYPLSDDLAVWYWHGPITEETEADINRLLTAFRGTFYRVGGALERQLTDLAMNGGGLNALVQAAAETSGLPMAVYDARGRALAASSDAGEPLKNPGGESGEAWFRRQMSLGATLTFGPLTATQRVIARFLGDRLAVAASAALQRDDAARPRGQLRIDAIASLLSGSASNPTELRAAALALGFDPDGVYFVAVSKGANDTALAKSLANLGSVHPAGMKAADGRRTALVATTSTDESRSLLARVADVKRHWEAAHAEDQAALALSATAHGVAALPAASREANVLASMQAQGHLAQQAASFASVTDVGALRLLYPLRGSDEIREFVSEALGALATRDRQGTLRETLRVFLESGGSHVEASGRLGIHRNTLAYRLRRIGELLGVDVAEPAGWLTLHLALCASDMLRAIEDDH
jgi:hypothetical protein